ISLFIYRLLEKKLDYKYTTSQILSKLKSMIVIESKGDGYIPGYTRDILTDELHELFNFRTDYEINTYKDFEKIFKQLK
ncbi:MAG: transposase, partial [Bacilli bacterium]